MRFTKTYQVRVLVAVLAVATLACSFGGLSGGGDDTSSVLYFDNFSDENSGWPRYNEADRVYDYSNGGYRITVSRTNYFLWSVVEEAFAEASIEVGVQNQSGPVSSEAGIVCRFQNDDNFYFMTVTMNGQYAISKWVNGSEIVLGTGDYEFSEAINQGETASNEVRGDCVGDSLTLYVNGELLLQVTDTQFSSGQVGLIVGTFEEANANFLFDNFAVYRP